ncbi:MAG: hypothetical protein GY862_16250, partial [Gammaproteobacteria bacterium]|nr:hypothetical protein [Gammaproteobacteria bacterium]
MLLFCPVLPLPDIKWQTEFTTDALSRTPWEELPYQPGQEFDSAGYDSNDYGENTHLTDSELSSFIMLLSCSINLAAIANVSNKSSVCSRHRRMAETKTGKQEQPPPPREEEGAMPAGAQAEREVSGQQSMTSVPPWAGYGRFKTICHQQTKA